jgi:hypothetical protein
VWENEKSIQNFGWKTLREEATWKTKAKGENSVEMDIGEVVYEGLDCIELTQARIQL